MYILTEEQEVLIDELIKKLENSWLDENELIDLIILKTKQNYSLQNELKTANKALNDLRSLVLESNKKGYNK